MRTSLLALAFVVLLGAAHAATYASIADAVKQLPELSTLDTNLQGTTLNAQFSDPTYIGTVFLPTNDALSSLSAQVGGDFQSMMQDNPDQATQVFSNHVVPGQALLTSALKPGTTLKSLAGESLNVTNSGGIIYINGVPITKGNIIAGKSIIHEINGVLLPADLAQLLGATSSTDGTDPFADFTVDDGTTTSTTTSTDAAGTTSAATGTTAASVPSTSSSEVSVDAASTTAASPAPAAAATTTTTSTGVVDKSGAGAAQLGAAVLAMPLLLALLA